MTCACPSRKSSACCRINKKVCPALHESRTRSDYQQTKGGVGGLASPSTFNRKPASPFGAFKRGEAPVRRFSKQSEGLLPYTNERPGERRSRSTSERVQNSTKWLCYFVDTLSVSCWEKESRTRCFHLQCLGIKAAVVQLLQLTGYIGFVFMVGYAEPHGVSVQHLHGQAGGVHQGIH